MKKKLLIFISTFNLFAFSESIITKKQFPNISNNNLIKKNENIFNSIKYNEENSLKKIQKLKNLNLSDYEKRTLLHYAVIYKKYTITKYLLKNGAKPYLQDIKGDTPLHIAVKNGDLEFIKLFLLSPGSSFALFIKNAKGLTPLDIALKKNNQNILLILKLFLENENLIKKNKNKKIKKLL